MRAEICQNCVACMAGMYIFAQAIVFRKIFPYNKTVLFKLVQLRTSIGKEKFPMITINMLSRADSVKGQGVLSAYQEQVKLVKEELADEFLCYENKNAFCDIMHYHTINPEFYAMRQLSRGRSVSVGYVHFLPETLDKSLKLPDHIRDVFYRYVIRFYKGMDYLVTVNPYFIGELGSMAFPGKSDLYSELCISGAVLSAAGRGKSSPAGKVWHSRGEVHCILCRTAPAPQGIL